MSHGYSHVTDQGLGQLHKLAEALLSGKIKWLMEKTNPGEEKALKMWKNSASGIYLVWIKGSNSLTEGALLS